MTDKAKPESDKTAFERMKELARRIVNVPKSELPKPKRRRTKRQARH